MIDLEIDTFEQVLDSNIKVKGIEAIITEVIFPFLEKIGILWLTNHINPAQEHLVTNIIRQKLVVGIDNTGVKSQVEKTVLLFLPEGEHHELGLLYVHYLLKNKGVKTLYLGADVPLADLNFIVQSKKPDFIYSHLTGTISSGNFEKFLHNIHLQIPESPVIISGPLTQVYKKSIPPNIHFKMSIAEVMEAFM